MNRMPHRLPSSADVHPLPPAHHASTTELVHVRPSLRSWALSLTLRLTVKRHLKPGMDLMAGRALMDKVTAKLVPPAHVGFTPTTLVDPAGLVPDLAAEWVDVPEARRDRVMLYMHGGAYVMGSPRTHRDLTWRLAVASGARLLVIDYRLAPEHPFPAAVEDALAAYRWLMAQGYDPARLGVGGDSAGGGLALASLIAMRDAGMALPAYGLAMSPWTDLSLSGDSLNRHILADPMLRGDMADETVGYYVGKDQRTHPHASPLFADQAGLPPLMIQVGATESILDDSTRFARVARAAGVPVKLEIWPHLPHVFQAFGRRLPEGKRAVARLGQFVRQNVRDVENV